MMAVNSLLMIVLIFFLYQLIKGTRKHKRTSQRTYLLLGSYVLVLCVGLALFLLDPYPEVDILAQPIVNEPNLTMFDLLDQVVDEGVPIAQFSEYKQNAWTFDLAGNTLHIQGAKNEMDQMSLVIEVKDTADGIVDVSLYSRPVQVNQRDLSHFIHPTDVTFLEGNRLRITGASGEIKLVSFQKEFIFTQFAKEVPDEDYFLMPEISLDDDLLYIRLPQGVTIENLEAFYTEYVK